MTAILRYTSLYEYNGPLGHYQFIGNWHPTREEMDRAAAHELSIEHNTRRIAVVRITKVKPH